MSERSSTPMIAPTRQPGSRRRGIDVIDTVRNSSWTTKSVIALRGTPDALVALTSAE